MTNPEIPEQPSFISRGTRAYGVESHFEEVRLPDEAIAVNGETVESELIQLSQDEFTIAINSIVLGRRGLAVANQDKGLSRISRSMASGPDLDLDINRRAGDYITKHRAFGESPEKAADYTDRRAKWTFDHVSRAWQKLYGELGKAQTIELFKQHLLDIGFQPDNAAIAELDRISHYSDSQVEHKLFVALKNLYLGKEARTFRRRLRKRISKILENSSNSHAV